MHPFAQALFLLTSGLSTATAGEFELSSSLPTSALAETRPGGHTPVDLTLSDYIPATNMQDITLAWVEESLQWVRVSEVLLVPTATLLVEASGASGGTITTGGRTFRIDEGGRAKVTMALLTGVANPTTIRLTRHGEVETGELTIEGQPHGTAQAARDTTCIRNQVEVTPSGKSGDWAFVGCRRTWTRDRFGRSAALELYVLWDGEEPVTIGGAPAEPATSNTWALRVDSEPGSIRLDRPEASLQVDYKLRPRFHDGVFGLSVGPAISFQTSERGRRALGIARAHMIYELNDFSRVVLFDALITDDKAFINDGGGYYAARTASLFDRRMELYALLGGHLQTFRATPESDYTTLLTLPQGADLLIKDAPFRSWWFRVGGFVQPPVRKRWYYQAYARFGQVVFLEANFTSWQQDASGQPYRHERLGITLGSQLIPFL